MYRIDSHAQVHCDYMFSVVSSINLASVLLIIANIRRTSKGKSLTVSGNAKPDGAGLLYQRLKRFGKNATPVRQMDSGQF